MRKPETKHLTVNRGFQGIPGVEVTPNGRLWATWYSGGVTEGPDNFVAIATSVDGGRTWSEAVAVIDPPGNVRAFDPTLWLDPQKRLWVFWAQSCVDGTEGTISDGENGVWGAYAADVESASPAWSEPVRIADGVMMNKPTVLENGAWALPVSVWDNRVGNGVLPERLAPFMGANMFISEDQGRTFFRRGVCRMPEGRTFDEHWLVELQDGRLWCVCRTSYGIGQGFSRDGGATWQDIGPAQIPGPGSRLALRRLLSEKLLLINHQIDPELRGLRQKLTAYLSVDEGRSWSGGLLLDERAGVSYPDCAQTADGRIYVIYDHERYRHGDILLASFCEEEILSGKLSRPGSFLSQKVSHTGGVKAGICKG